MARRRNNIPDTQLAFDLWGDFEEQDSNHAEQSAPHASAQPDGHADGRLFDESWAHQQSVNDQSGVGRDRGTDRGLAGRAGDHVGGSDEATRADASVADAPFGGDQRSVEDDGERLSGAAARVRAGFGGRDAVPGRLGASRSASRRVDAPVDVDGGPEWRRTALRPTRAGIETEELGGQEIADSGRSSREPDVPAGVPGSEPRYVPAAGGSRRSLVGGVAAVTALQRILQDGREPTTNELAELRQFPGWGALPELFDPKNDKYEVEREALNEVWGDAEWRAARRTVLNAHYTNPEYVDAMWQALGQLGVPASGQVLEPGCGSGNFIDAAPAATTMTGVELDPTTAKIAQFTHPDATILNESFADTLLSGDGFDAVIGNVPFAQTVLHDPAYNQAGLSLHNHFIAKSLRMTKPGGVVAVMSSRWTMDARSERARREIAKYGELLGAVRMPAGAHGETAGTDAVIDVLVFRRHDEPHVDVAEPEWVRTVDHDGAAGTVALNTYFADHPEMVLGRLDTRNGRFGPEVSVTADDVSAAAIAPALQRALGRIVADANAAGRGWAAATTKVTDRPVARVVQDQTRLVGRVYVSETGELEMIGLTGAERVNVPKNAQAEVRMLLELRDAAVNLLNAEAATLDDSVEIASLRADLNRVYDGFLAKYGPLGRFTETVRPNRDPLKEPIVTRRYPPALKALRTDPHFATLVALEHYNDDTGLARKATIFEKRVVAPIADVQSVDSPDDAIRISLDRVGHVDLPLVAELLDTREADLLPLLGDRVFLSPDAEGTYLPAAEYLSGNVRQKLAVVRELEQTDPRFAPHVAALEQVIPAELGPAEINVRFGAGWVPTEVVAEFIRRELGKETRAVERIDGEWKFEIRGSASTTAEAKWSVTGRFTSMHAKALFKDVLAGRKLEMRYKVDEQSFVDQEATETLQERAAELHEAFQDWLWNDPTRAEAMQTRYNDLYNGIVLRSYDGSKLSFPGKAATWEPYPHQHAAVARMLAEPSAGLFHEVGAGKTAEMVMGVMELKRLGMVNKPAIIVPNQMLEQFTREFKQIYPRAKVLSAGSADIAQAGGKDARKLFVHRARANDWDCVIMTHTAFQKIGLGAATKVYAEEKLAELTEIHEARLGSELSNRSVKDLEKKIASEEEKLKKMIDLDWDAGVSWDETGIDYLCVDEAHLFKNLTVSSSVDDLSKQGSDRAQDLDMKLWYHRDHLKQSHVATLATATPLPNSMVEMYVMMRYLRPDLLKAAEVYRADDWARQFTEQVTAVEPKPAGGGFHTKTRTARFRNLPELLHMWHVSGDVKTQADLGLKVPELAVNSDGKRAPEMVLTPATAVQQEAMGDLIVRAQRVKDRQVQPEEDNMLKVTSDGRAIALDARLRDMEGPEPEETTKVDVVADNVFRIWEETRDTQYLDEWGDPSGTPGGLQIVFSDLGTPKSTDEWDVYHHVRDRLVAKGMPAEAVRFIHEAGDDKAKAELFQQCRDGRVKVLMGSTEKMGVGTNVQARAIALHHIDAPWRPADVTQREGRIVRQKNQNDEVSIYRYATEGSFDAYMWGTLARKATFIEQVLTGRLDVREADVSSEMALQFSEMQAITLGDMRILEIANLRQDTGKLTRQQRGHQRKIDTIRNRRIVQEGVARSLVHDLKLLNDLLPHVVDTKGDLFRGSVRGSLWRAEPMTTSREEFGKALQHQLTVAEDNARRGHGWGPHNQFYPKPLGVKVSIGGIEWDAHLRWNEAVKSDPIVEFHANGAQKALRFEMRMSRIRTGELKTLSRAFEQRASGLSERIVEDSEKLVAAETAVKELSELEQEPWAHKATLDEKQQRLMHLVEQIEREAAPQQPQGHVQPPDVPIPPAQAVQM